MCTRSCSTRSEVASQAALALESEAAASAAQGIQAKAVPEAESEASPGPKSEIEPNGASIAGLEAASDSEAAEGIPEAVSDFPPRPRPEPKPEPAAAAGPEATSAREAAEAVPEAVSELPSRPNPEHKPEPAAAAGPEAASAREAQAQPKVASEATVAADSAAEPAVDSEAALEAPAQGSVSTSADTTDADNSEVSVLPDTRTLTKVQPAIVDKASEATLGADDNTASSKGLRTLSSSRSWTQRLPGLQAVALPQGLPGMPLPWPLPSWRPSAPAVQSPGGTQPGKLFLPDFATAQLHTSQYMHCL